VKPVPDDVRDILLNAEYFINMSIGPLPEDEETYIPTGLKWPD
jgi:hypothetical protein